MTRKITLMAVRCVPTVESHLLTPGKVYHAALHTPPRHGHPGDLCVRILTNKEVLYRAYPRSFFEPCNADNLIYFGHYAPDLAEAA